MPDETARRRRQAAENLRRIAGSLDALAVLLRQWATLYECDDPAPPFDELERAAAGVVDPEVIRLLKTVAGEF